MKVDENTVAAWMAEWDGMGWHRSGTGGDDASLHWLTAHAQCAGHASSLHEIAFTRRVSLRTAEFVVGNERFEGLPLFDAPGSDPNGVIGRLVPLGEDGVIGYTELRPDAATTGGDPFAGVRASTKHAAIIVATQSGDGGLAPLNAPHYGQPYGPPVLQVAGRHAPMLGALARRGLPARLEAVVALEPATTSNLAVSLCAPSPGESALWVVTPRTSWYESTAERGGGLATWLALLHCPRLATAASRPALLLATAGHEIGHLGIRHYLRALPAGSMPRLALHLGANLGASDPPMLSLRASQPAHALSMHEALLAAGYPAEALRIEGIETAVGEARDLLASGIDVVSLVGENRMFHAPGDRWPTAMSLPRVTAVVNAVRAWVVSERSRT